MGLFMTPRPTTETHRYSDSTQDRSFTVVVGTEGPNEWQGTLIQELSSLAFSAELRGCLTTILRKTTPFQSQVCLAGEQKPENAA